MKFLFLNSKAHLLLEQSRTAVSGGAELQVALLARALAGRGYATGIIHAGKVPEPARKLAGVHCIPGGPFDTGGLGDAMRALGPVLRAIRRQKPEFVLVLGWTAWLFLLWATRGPLRFKLGFICGLDTEADGTFAATHGLRGRLFDFAMCRANVRFAMSEHQQRLFHARGLDCGFYRNLILPRRAPLNASKDIDLLWIARCREIKRPLMFVKLAAQLPKARCLMVCPPEDRDLFARVRQEAAEVSNLTLREFVPYHESQDLYDRARILVNTSVVEGFANSFLQAGLGGAAILSLSVDCDGVLKTYNAGASVDDDFERLVATASHWLEDADVLGCKQRGSACFVSSNHDTDVNVNAFLAGLGIS